MNGNGDTVLKSKPIVNCLQTKDNFALEMRDLLNRTQNMTMPEGYLEAPLAYDAIWAVSIGIKALSCTRMQHLVHSSSPQLPALDKTIRLLGEMGQTIENYNYGNKEIGQIILEQIGDVKFEGISVSATREERDIKETFR